MGTIVTFYSWKGGVGRTLAVANTAVQLARSGRSVLMIDWDLEAPGLDRFFLRSGGVGGSISQCYAGRKPTWHVWFTTRRRHNW